MTAEILIDGVKVLCEVGKTVGECLSGDMPCGGHGRCGKCKVRALGELSPISEREREVLTEKEIKDGVRLACRTLVLGPCTVETAYLGSNEKEKIITDGTRDNFEPSHDFVPYGVALDIGTTTLAARLYGDNGTLLAKSSRINPQSVFGADVVSRIEGSINGGSCELQRLVCTAINEMLCEMAENASVDVKEINSMVVTGNTAMLQFFTNTSAENLARAPFHLKRPFGETIFAKDVGLNILLPDAKIFLPHCISAFVGADTVCAMLSANLCDREETSLLVDVGTNGEMCLWHEKTLYTTSTAAGPCFEGVGISCGMRAKTGAVDRVWIENGKIALHVVGDTEANGICGSGLVDTVAALLSLGAISDMGNIDDGRYEIAGGLFIEQSDISALQMAKSAICAGVKTLLHIAGVDEVESTDIAGGFGSSLNIENALRIGLLPRGTGNIRAVGNAALDGASMLLLNRKLREKCDQIVKMAKSVQLAESDVFYDNYVSGMMFDI